MNITYNEIANYKETIDKLLSIQDQYINITMDDKIIEMKRKYAIIHLHFWWILLKYQMPVTTKYILFHDIVSDKEIGDLMSMIYADILEAQDITNPKFDFWTAINDLHNFIIRECNEYHCSLSILELAELAHSKQMRAITDKMDFDEKSLTSVVEKKMDEYSSKLNDTLTKPFKENVLYEYHRLGYINRMQLPQVLLAIGTRTDVNDMIVRYPIKSSFLSGMTNVIEYIVESLSAKKCAFYNKIALPNSQYFARKQHLITSSIAHIYKGDCGTNLTMPFFVHDDNHKDLVGKFHVKNGKRLTITKDNTKDLIGNTIEMRSPLSCRYRDGLCEVCGGMLTRYLIDGVSPGILSAQKFSGQVTQKILSAKHLQNTTSVTYVPPDILSEFLTTKKDKIYWRKDRENAIKDWKLGVPIYDIRHISDLNLIKNDSAINPEHFSKITKMCISTISNDEHITKIINMESNRTYPYFSKEMLIYIRENYDRLTIGDTVWIPLDKFDINNPIFKSLVLNDSMLVFVETCKSALESKISGYTSIPEALKDLSNIIYNKVSVNIFHIETLLKSYLITSEFDYSIPEVTDIDNVKFQTLSRINVQRSLGTFMAFENIYGTLIHPTTYLIPRAANPFDTYVGFKK